MTTVNRTYRAVYTPTMPSRVERIVRIYHDAPFHVQRQWAAMFLLGLVSLLMIAALYVNITVRAGTAGRMVQTQRLQNQNSQRAISDLEMSLASASTVFTLEQRAIALGFQTVEPLAVEYVPVPGFYIEEYKSFVAPSVPQQEIEHSYLYQESLLDWLNRQFQLAALP